MQLRTATIADLQAIRPIFSEAAERNPGRTMGWARIDPKDQRNTRQISITIATMNDILQFGDRSEAMHIAQTVVNTACRSDITVGQAAANIAFGRQG